MIIADLEKFYRIGNVQGVAFVNLTGELVEDQLVFSPEVSLHIAEAFHGIMNGLKTAGRKSHGFVVRLSKNEFLGIPVNTGIVIFQLSAKNGLDEVYRQILSILSITEGNTGIAQAAMTVPAPVVSVPQPPARTLNVSTPSLPALPVVAKDDPIKIANMWQEFSTALVKALTNVAPGPLAKKLLDDAANKVLAGAAFPSNAQQILAIGRAAVDSIPNKGRRQLIEQELIIIAQRVGIM